jgi:hypothetical protein
MIVPMLRRRPYVKRFNAVIGWGVVGVLLASPMMVVAQSPHGAKAQRHNEIVLPDDRLVVGVVEEVRDNQVKVNTGELTSRYLPQKEETENRRRPLIKGDMLEIWVNNEDVVVDYHPLDTLGWHKIIRAVLVQPLAVDQEWAVIKRDKGKEEAYAIRPLARSKVAAMPVGSPSLFLVDKANKIVDATFGSREALTRAAERWRGSPPMGVDREVAGTMLKSKSATAVTIQIADGAQQTFEARSFILKQLRKIPPGKSVTLLIDGENKVIDVAIPSR